MKKFNKKSNKKQVVKELAEHFQNELDRKLPITVLPGGAANLECERDAMNPCIASLHSSGVHALRNRAYALQLATDVQCFFLLF
jgi:hypothetical protein